MSKFVLILCVLKTGGMYTAEHVKRLISSVEDNITNGCLIACLTDDPNVPGEYARPLRHGLPGWWSKLEAFRYSGPIIYLDLDTVVVDSLMPIANAVRKNEDVFYMLHDFNRPGTPASGVMAWGGNMEWIFQRFLALKSKRYSPGKVGMAGRFGHDYFNGDQDYIQDCIKWRQHQEVLFLQDHFDGIYSYKKHIRGKGELPLDARLICFHGIPRIHDVPDFWNR